MSVKYRLDTCSRSAVTALGFTVTNADLWIVLIEPMARRCCHRVSKEHSNGRSLLKQQPVTLNSRQRAAVESGIRETCTLRKWSLWALNIRTNHVRAVVSANQKPDAVLIALKANATRSMKEAGCWKSEISPWAHCGSKKYLWTEKGISRRNSIRSV